MRPTKATVNARCAPMIHAKPVIVVVPARDEAPRIDRVLRRMPPFVDHIVVVDDGSTDDTRSRAVALLGGRGTVVRHERAQGVGAAISHGYRLAALYTDMPHAAVAVMAGDDQMHPDDLEAVVTPIVLGAADYVKGDRFAWPDRARAMPLGRKLGGTVFAAATSMAIGRRIHDSQCGYTAISRTFIDRIDLASFWPGFGYPNVLLGELARANANILEVPVRAVYADEVSRLRMKHVVTIGRLIAREAWKTHGPSSR